jgi:hypothetical protein
VTLWAFLGQVLSADHSCRAAVARLIAHRVARGQRPCSAKIGAYCQARRRLPDELFSSVACSVGHTPDDQAAPGWLWKGRRVYLFVHQLQGAMQTLEAFEPLLELGAARSQAECRCVGNDLLDAIATHRVADRPARFKPRVKKRRRNHYCWLNQPRAEIKRKMAKGVLKIYVPFVRTPEAVLLFATPRCSVRTSGWVPRFVRRRRGPGPSECIGHSVGWQNHQVRPAFRAPSTSHVGREGPPPGYVLVTKWRTPQARPGHTEGPVPAHLCPNQLPQKDNEPKWRLGEPRYVSPTKLRPQRHLFPARLSEPTTNTVQRPEASRANGKCSIWALLFGHRRRRPGASE